MNNLIARFQKGCRGIRSQDRILWPAVAAIIAAFLFLSTLQVNVNSSGNPYATDVGEIQNALPRWGLIHRSGYPLYTAVGSLFVTVLRLVGIEPAVGVSLFSALWGGVFVALFVVLIQDMGMSGPAAVLGSLSVALSTGVWVDASLAEVHTLTLVFTVVTLIFALRFGRTGKRRDLLLLALCFTQGVSHQRSVILLAPAVAVLAWPQWRVFLRNLVLVVAVSLLALLVYLYMPFRVLTGATWVFGSPGTWDGFWEMVFDNRGGRVFTLSAGLDDWLTRIDVTLRILSDDMWWPLLVLGLLGLFLLIRKGNWREGVGMMLAWVPNFFLTVVIWRNQVIDAQLAAKLPVVMVAGVGLAVLLERAKHWSRPVGIAVGVIFALALAVWGWQVRPTVLSITRDSSTEVVVDMVEQLFPLPEGRITTLVVPWGHDYWTLAYTQKYRGQLEGLNLVDHNVNLRAVVEDGRLLTPAETFIVFPSTWWETELGGRVYMSSAAPRIVEVGTSPPVDAGDVPLDVNFDLGNGLRVRSASLAWRDTADQLTLVVYWEALQPVSGDYSVAVHLVAQDPPQGAHDLLDQADAPHPVGGWYPTSLWMTGEIVRDDYVLNVPSSTPVAVRIAMYQVDANGAFVNTEWLSLPIPE